MPSFEYAADRNATAAQGKKHASANAFIGRAVLSPSVLNLANNLRSDENPLLKISIPLTPSIVYLHAAWLSNTRDKGMAKSHPRLGVPPSSRLPDRIRAPEDVLTAIFESRKIDSEVAYKPIELAVKKVRAKRNFRRNDNTYNVAVVAYDKPNDFYDEAYSLRGESKVLGKLRNFNHVLPDIDPDDPVPTHFVKLAEVSIPELDLRASDEIIERLRSGILSMVGDMVELSPIQLIG